MKVGFLGLGRIGLMHATHLAQADHRDVAEIHLFDPTPGFTDRARTTLRTAAGVEAKAADSVETLLREVDAVVVATPTPSHPDLLRTCVDAGVTTLCEKPVASDLSTLRRVVDFIEAAPTTVVVGFQRRFDPALREIKGRIESGTVGKIYVVRSNAYDDFPAPVEIIRESDGIYKDLMIHDLDAVPWLVNEPVVEVNSWGSVLVDEAYADNDDVDFATATLRFAGGALGVMVAGRRNPAGYDHRIEVLGSGQSLVQGWGARTPITSTEPDGYPYPTNPYWGFADRFERAYRAEIAEFVDIAAGRAPNPSPVRDSLVSVQLADACDQSRRTGRPVAIESVVAAG